jgi:diketogulonate reductase-like aldo/keto reductase
MFEGAIKVLERELQGLAVVAPIADMELAEDAVRGSMWEAKWRFPAQDYPHRAEAVQRALVRLRGMPQGKPFEPMETPPLGIGWGTYGWKGDPACVRAAIDGGAVLIDTAATYGYGRVEKALGSAGLADRGLTRIATKFARNHARRGPVLASLGRSLSALKLHRLDLFQLHWPNPEVSYEETLGAMREALIQGLTRAVGVCNVSVDLLHLMRFHAPISTVQVRLNNADLDALGPLARYCHAHGIRLIAHSPFEQRGAKRPLSWWTERQFIPIPGSNNPNHILENLGAES